MEECSHAGALLTRARMRMLATSPTMHRPFPGGGFLGGADTSPLPSRTSQQNRQRTGHLQRRRARPGGR